MQRMTGIPIALPLLTGVGVDEPDRSRAMRFDHWSFELSHSDRPFERLSTLCEVDRRKRPERTG